jgi:NAD(P)-dependent dehydrogenase (short-subunit alcohol dehydrogenase family)
MPADFTLTDRVVVITGASRGIGEEIARAAAGAGAKVVLAARKQDGLDAVAAAIRGDGGTALAIAAHTGKPEDVAGLFDKAIAEFGGWTGWSTTPPRTCTSDRCSASTNQPGTRSSK